MVTGNHKYRKRQCKSPADVEDIESMERHFLHTIGERLKNPQVKEKEEESIFEELIASQLRQLGDQERTLAKMEISNVISTHLLRKNTATPTRVPQLPQRSFLAELQNQNLQQMQLCQAYDLYGNK